MAKQDRATEGRAALPVDKNYEKWAERMESANTGGAFNPTMQVSDRETDFAKGKQGPTVGRWALMEYVGVKHNVGKYKKDVVSAKFIEGTMVTAPDKAGRGGGSALTRGTVYDFFCGGQLSKFAAGLEAGAVFLIRYTGMPVLPKGHANAGEHSHTWDLSKQPGVKPRRQNGSAHR